MARDAAGLADASGLLTTREVAARWRISARTLERWRADRYGPAWLVLGGRVLYRLADIETFEARRRVTVP